MTETGDAVPPVTVNIGVLALQGSFREHIAMLRRLPGVNASEVRNRQQLEASDGLIIPGQQYHQKSEKFTEKLCSAFMHTNDHLQGVRAQQWPTLQRDGA